MDKDNKTSENRDPIPEQDYKTIAIDTKDQEGEICFTDVGPINGKDTL